MVNEMSSHSERKEKVIKHVKIDEYNFYAIDFSKREVKWEAGNFREGGSGIVTFNDFIIGVYPNYAPFGREPFSKYVESIRRHILNSSNEITYFLEFGADMMAFEKNNEQDIRQAITSAIFSGKFPIKLYKNCEPKQEVNIFIDVNINL